MDDFSRTRLSGSDRSLDQRRYISNCLRETYFKKCITLCLEDYQSNLSGKDKVTIINVGVSGQVRRQGQRLSPPLLRQNQPIHPNRKQNRTGL
jgi:hypothetical protein